ncbi:hypothetical protein HU200_052919 [Digitaria exilis]|uniref:UBL3-like ubiquitin domain-containing protein n=1 Tax=Digitaria exilis TaxID=1010633 RepID=A0A835AK66_9POAL|nr:hypothetical protein HU200_052919 [Digitaria exilis]
MQLAFLLLLLLFLSYPPLELPHQTLARARVTPSQPPLAPGSRARALSGWDPQPSGWVSEASRLLAGGREMAEKEGAKVGAEEMEEREREGEEEEEEEEVEVKFRLFDGSDIGPIRCNAAATTVAALKDRVVADWPKGT